MRVLVVPAEAAALDPVRSWAESRAVALDTAPNFEEAGARMESEAFDLVLCDVRGGGEAGLRLLGGARSVGLEVPFVLLTPGSADEISHRARALGRGLCVPARLLDAHGLDEVVGLATGAAPKLRPPEQVGDLAPAMLFKADQSGAFTQFTSEWCRFTGRSPEQEQGGGWLAGIHPDDFERWQRRYRPALREGRRFEIDLRLRRADGAFRWLRVRGLPRRSGGVFAGYVGSAFDIHNLKDTHAGLLSDVERLASVNADLQQFASAAAHDLDEPLRTLEQSLAQVTAGEGAEELELARANARRMRALVRDLLDCALVGQGEGRLEEVDLSLPLGWALENLDRRLRETGGEVTHDELPEVRCDPVQIARAFQNLIGNALKFRSEAAPRIHVRAELSRREVLLRVRDNGIGISAEHHERIFEPFKRAHARPSAPDDDDPESGSGIGLALCKRIAERHGGRIWVESAPGSGSTFCLVLKR